MRAFNVGIFLSVLSFLPVTPALGSVDTAAFFECNTNNNEGDLKTVDVPKQQCPVKCAVSEVIGGVADPLPPELKGTHMDVQGWFAFNLPATIFRSSYGGFGYSADFRSPATVLRIAYGQSMTVSEGKLGTSFDSAVRLKYAVESEPNLNSLEIKCWQRQ